MAGDACDHSRMGVIFLSEEDVDVNSLTTTWLRKQDAKVRPRLAALVS